MANREHAEPLLVVVRIEVRAADVVLAVVVLPPAQLRRDPVLRQREEVLISQVKSTGEAERLARISFDEGKTGMFEVLDVLTSGKRSNTPLSVPLWMPQSIWFAGMLLFAAGAVVMALHSVFLLWRDRGLLNRAYGPQSLEEEIATEIGHVEERESVSRTGRT